MATNAPRKEFHASPAISFSAPPKALMPSNLRSVGSFDLPRRAGNHAFGALLGPGVLQRKCACGGTCSHCQEEEQLRRKTSDNNSSHAKDRMKAVGSVEKVLRSPGQPLDTATRSFFETQLSHDFREVRVHADTAAAESARSVNALAYTVGRDIVFATGQYSPQTSGGQALLAHELTHVTQQRTGVLQRQQAPGRQGGPQTSATTATGGHCSGGLAAAPAAGFWVCSRPTALFGAFNHGYIVAGQKRYGLMKRCQNLRGPIPLVTGADLGLPTNPTAARTTDHSPDPCPGNQSGCCECRPRPGITNLDDCFSRAFSAYPRVSEYVVLPGPNSNTFAGTMARTCCEDMDSPPPVLGSVPGWNHSPASATQAVCTEGEGTCGNEPISLSQRIGHGLRGMVAGGLLGAAGGAGAGALIGAIIGSIVPGIGTLIGLGTGAAIGAAVGGGLGGLIGLIAGLR